MAHKKWLVAPWIIEFNIQIVCFLMYAYEIKLICYLLNIVLHEYIKGIIKWDFSYIFYWSTQIGNKCIALIFLQAWGSTNTLSPNAHAKSYLPLLYPYIARFFIHRIMNRNISSMYCFLRDHIAVWQLREQEIRQLCLMLSPEGTSLLWPSSPPGKYFFSLLVHHLRNNGLIRVSVFHTIKVMCWHTL